MKRIIWALGGILICCCSLLLFSCGETCAHGNQSTELISPTCDQEGYTLHTCQDCSAQYKTDYAVPTGHTLRQETVPATCTEEGYIEYACTCGYIYKGSFSEPTGHVYETIVVDPTCESEGYIEHLCTVCEHTYRAQILSALGHELSATVAPSTCDSRGYTEYVCERGDLTYRSDYTEPLGHTMITTLSELPTQAQSGRLTQQCTACDYHFTNYLLFSDVFANAYTVNTAYLAKGIDISYHNHTPNSSAPSGYDPLNWAVIKKAGFDFAILRAGYTGFQDPVFETNYTDAKAAGMDLGVYYYTYAKNTVEAQAEAEELLGWLKGKQFEYPIYYDIEDTRLTELGKETLTELCMTFVDTLRRAGYYGAVYSNNTWLTNYLSADELKGYCELWYARYQRDPKTTSEAFPTFTILPDDNEFTWLEKYGNQVGLWQYTQCGVIENSGMDQRVDMNYAYKDYPALMKKFCLNGYTAASVQ